MLPMQTLQGELVIRDGQCFSVTPGTPSSHESADGTTSENHPSTKNGKRCKRRRKTDFISREVISQYLKFSQEEAAKHLGISVATLKRKYYELDMGKRWPVNRSRKTPSTHQVSTRSLPPPPTPHFKEMKEEGGEVQRGFQKGRTESKPVQRCCIPFDTKIPTPESSKETNSVLFHSVQSRSQGRNNLSVKQIVCDRNIETKDIDSKTWLALKNCFNCNGFKNSNE